MDTLAEFLGGLAGILMLGVFVRVVTLLSILRFGLGLEGHGMGLAMGLLAFVLSLIVLEIKSPLHIEPAAVFSGQSIFKGPPDEKIISDFLAKNSDAALLARMQELSAKKPAAEGTSVKLGAYLLTQLQESFKAGALLLIPFVIIDLLVSVAFTAIGVTNMRSASLAVPLKLLLFVAVDGWSLLTGKLLGI